MFSFKHIILTSVCALALAGCQTSGAVPAKAEAKGKQQPIEFTGGVSTDMLDDPALPTDPNVQMYKTEGPFANPLDADRTHSVLDNTTSGGYTVFDDSVTVYPLPGDSAPAFMPNYAVPPLEGQYKTDAPKLGGTQPMGLASAGTLPPVPNMDVQEADPYANPPVPGAVRSPMTLTSPEPLTMQPPAQARPPMASPFAKVQPLMDDGMTPAMDTPPAMPVLSAPAAAPAMQTETKITVPQTTAPGRRSSPLLTGY